MAETKEFQEAVAKEVAKQLGKAGQVGHALLQDQLDLLSIVAPNKFARYQYEVIEPVTE